MKTIKEWFKELPEEYREDALRMLDSSIEHTEVISMSKALICGFNWYDEYDMGGVWSRRHNLLISQGL